MKLNADLWFTICRRKRNNSSSLPDEANECKPASMAITDRWNGLTSGVPCKLEMFNSHQVPTRDVL